MDRLEISNNDSYKSISTLSAGIYKDSGSKFLSFAYPVEDEEEIKAIINSVKKDYFDATHHCYAYRLGLKGEPWRMNDDGEPSSTAGRPIYGQLLSYNLSDILVVVVRYFGGTKLGVPGLIKAYKTATADALSKASIIDKVVKEQMKISFDYENMNTVMRILKDFSIVPYNQEYDNSCLITVDVRLRDIDSFKKKLQETILKISICQKA
jgi:Uncharacterized conserved protein